MDDEDRAFYRLYGDWATLTPPDAAALLDGLDAPWWIAGGWAIEAFTGVARRHEDVDVAFFGADLPTLRAHFASTHHLWAAGSGTLRPLSDRFPRQPRWSQQVWVREHALAPWLLDLLTSAESQDRWVFKWDASVTRPLDEATWVAADGLRYLAPELVLAHEAKLDRAKDRADLDVTWPRLDDRTQRWLVDFIGRRFPRCSWLSDLRSAG